MSATGTLVEELRAIPAFADLPGDALDWLASRMEVVEFQPGEVFFHAGAPADRMVVILEGEVRGELEGGGDDGRVYMATAGEVTGMLPYSRLTVFPLTFRAIPKTRIATLMKNFFPELLERIPILGSRLVAVMADRIRNITRDEQHREKLAALGKLSAGLAHELNNPAAAAARAAKGLRDSVDALRDANRRLDCLALSAGQRSTLAEAEQQVLESAGRQQDADPLERSDREQTLGDWLEKHEVADAWNLASTLADAGVSDAQVERMAGQLPPEAIGDVLHRIGASLLVGGLVNQIEHSTSRISELVKAIKEYSFMDQGPQQEVDLHAGLDNTLLILHHRLKQGVTVKREYDRTLPKICAHGSELNQVWTNLIVNAVEAMGGNGELRIRTSRVLDELLVEIIDNGPGIPDEVRKRLFEPFFSTKGLGQGTGLGLDTANRIVRQHHGRIHVETRPGETNFQVQLPISLPKRG